MILATWNLNSVRARRAHLLDWLARARPDVVCLQEIKVVDRDFPLDAARELGYHTAIHGQPTYNGVAILSRAPIDDVRIGLGDDVDDPQARLIAARIDGVRVISAYFPNGGEVGSDKWTYKLSWMARVRAYLERNHTPDEPLALCGDFNVAPDDLDVARPADWAETAMCHPDGRAALESLRDWGLVDVFRAHHPGGGVWSWWDYRNSAFPRDDGLRIDHIWATPVLASRCASSEVDRDERERDKPSDHAPVVATFGDLADGSIVAPAASAAVAPATTPAPVPTTLSPSVPPTSSAPAPTTPATRPPAPRSSRSASTTALGSGPSSPKLVIIDGHSLAYRAFYGMPLYDRRGKVSFSNAAGEYTNAVYGFANMLVKTWNDEKPDYIAVAFDGGRTFRDDLFDAYKGTREKMPDELSPQIGRIIQLVQAFDIPAIVAEGYEGDDILGTLATRAAADGINVLIVTGDTDAFQLIGPRVRVLAPGRLWSDVAVWDEAGIVGRYGMAPAQLIDFKALKGDTSDNIPGVRGIGEKTAQALLGAYGSVEGIYEHLGEVTPDRARNALEAGRDMAFLSKDLVTIRTAIPLDVTWDDCAVHSYDRAKVEALFDVLGFRSIRSRLPAGGVMGTGSAASASGAGSPAAAGAGDADGTSAAAEADTDGTSRSSPPSPSPAAAAPPSASGQMSLFPMSPGAPGAPVARPENPPDTRAIVVDDAAGLATLAERLNAAEIISFDTETTGTDPMVASLVGIALAVEPGEGYYIPVGHVDAAADLNVVRQLPWKTIRAAIAPALEDPARPKVGHNAKYDIIVLRLAGIDVRGLAWDTMLAEFLIDATARLGLKALAKSRLGYDMTEIATLIGTGRKQITMAQVAIADAAGYAAADVDMTLRLMQLQAPELDAVADLARLMHDVDLPLVPVLVDMEMTGVMVDTAQLALLSDRLAARQGEIETAVYQTVGVPFNLNSPQQLGEILFGRLGLKAPGGRQTATGKASVAADVLDGMRGLHPIIDLILEHRQITKLKGTYVDALPRMVNPRTGRVHTSYNQTGAVSGRLASQDPNLQNIPIRTELGREVRQAFVVPPGWKLIAADYSQVELRIAAHICNDPGLRAAFAAGEDIHRATAATVLGIAPEAVTADQRRFAKSVNFGLLYGMGVQALAQQTGSKTKDAQAFIDAYFAGFPNIKRYIEDTKRAAREVGHVETLMGRRRYFPVLGVETTDGRTRMMQASAEREAVNHPMQGTAADIIKVAMIRIHAALAERGLRARLLLQVHDELVLEAPDDEADEVVELVRTLMEGAYPLDPPLKVDVGVGLSWDDVK